MSNQIDQLKNLLKIINTKLGNDMVSSQEIIEIEKNIFHLQDDLGELSKTIQNCISSKISMTHTLVHINKYLGNAIQDLQDIRETMIFIAGRYSDYKDKHGDIFVDEL